MSHPDIDTALDWRGRTVRGSEGEKIGTFGAVYLDESDRPAWGGVRTGLFGRQENFIPLDSVDDDGEDLRVPFDKQQVKDAPHVDPDVALTPDDERALYAHYGREYGGDTSEERAAEREPEGAEREPEGAMTRSEEEVEVRPGPMRPAERVRLRKVEVTEHQKRVVPVQREVVALETDEGVDESSTTTQDREG